MSRKGEWFTIASLALALACAQAGRVQREEYRTMIDQGEFTRAGLLIAERLKEPGLSPAERAGLEFEIERMARIRKDFVRNEAEVVEFIKIYIPDVDSARLAAWEAEKSLEMMRIDGEKRYFKYAARNLFRINKACREIWRAAHPLDAGAAGGPGSRALDENIARILAQATPAQPLVEPVRMRIEQTLTVNADAVPAGETIRCWLPFPREIPGRQTDIRLIGTTPEQHHLADTSRLQRTICFEQSAVAGTPARFQVTYEYTSLGSFTSIDPEKVTPAAAEGPLQPWLREEPPHIVFTPELRALAAEVAGGETNPYRIAQKLYAWVEENIPWASAREYS
ncbi:MAG TPA: transglutaminase domain-containing protein, partial [bacterium]|nr:transglutaminase domain-containing protein [bacterium]